MKKEITKILEETITAELPFIGNDPFVEGITDATDKIIQPLKERDNKIIQYLNNVKNTIYEIVNNSTVIRDEDSDFLQKIQTDIYYALILLKNLDTEQFQLTNKNSTFEQWFEQLKKYAIYMYDFTIESAETLDSDAYKSMYYDEGETVQYSFDEDMRNA
jgi:hypothetical protein